MSWRKFFIKTPNVHILLYIENTSQFNNLKLLALSGILIANKD